MKLSAKKLYLRAFTLLEIMIVVGIISLLAAIAIPAFAQARIRAAESVCISNLRQIDAAKSQWALDKRKGPGAKPKEKELFGVTLYLKEKPGCPTGGIYEVNKLSDAPTCTFPNHVLD